MGSENVYDDPQTLEEYSRDISFAPPVTPALVVKPSTAEEVIEIVRLASRSRTPLVPVSSGSPHFRGDTVPSVKGAIILDLSRMNRVLRVDRRNRVIMFEPGVTFTQLKEEAERHGMLPMMPLRPKKAKSALASYLEREPVLVPKYHWDPMDPLLCLEVISGTGEVIRTGSAAGPGNVEDLLALGYGLVSPLGPGQVDFARIFQGSQGTMGVATWATAKCRLKPSTQRLLIASSESLEELLPLAYRLLRRRLGEELLIMNRQCLLAVLGANTDWQLPQWVLAIVVAGYEFFPDERIEWQVEEVREAAQLAGVKLQEELDAASFFVINALQSPSDDFYWRLNGKEKCQEVFFITTLDRAPLLYKEMIEVAGTMGYPEGEVLVYLQPVIQGCAAHLELVFPYDTEYEELARRVYVAVSRSALRLGAFFSRPYGIWSEMVFTDPVLFSVLKRLKSIFDPYGILNPGKLCFGV